MITKARFSREGVDVKADYGEASLGVKWPLINAGYAVYLFVKELPGAKYGPERIMVRLPDGGSAYSVSLQSVIVATSKTHPQELALCRMWWLSAEEKERRGIPYNSWKLKVPTVKEAQDLLREGAFGFDKLDV